ncbi:MBL fold metallo-hydrolase RNA specificity domain-containing protein [Desulfopila sp. IMCC35008]|uniref:MBL fold metallo-hydrolase RNA specificity domain-containing protein n=1 Tax=Desulfopila sp. IMCC35008 TaxID=2653858 RepID=UPI0013D6A03C|nr:MBL fold metallo-hydrolase [Desulfopila sp. IMCC35008]
MHLTFHGATREVTGSFHTITTDHDRIVLDCGLFQGRRKEAETKNRVLPIDPQVITNIILSHAHLDHSGRIPMVTKEGFNGRIFCTRATAQACEYLLRDSAKIQEGDASYLNYKTARNFLAKLKSGGSQKKLSNGDMADIKRLLKAGNHRLNSEKITELLEEHQLQTIDPLYSMLEAEESLSYFNGVPYNHTATIGRDLTCTFYDAGHILGSAMAVVRKEVNGQSKNVMFTGDIGRFDKPIIQDPTLEFADEHREIDLLIMESTYGDRLHDPVKDMKPMLQKVLTETFDRGGSVMIPAFAYGRTQEIIYYLHELYLAGDVPRVPVYVDSPLATNITHVFGEHPETYDEDTHQTFLENGLNPFHFEHLKFVQTVEESMALNRDTRSHIVLAGSGMCEGGRILHHLRHKIHDERNTLLIVGYMGRNTFGRLIQDKAAAYEEAGRQGQAPAVRFYNKEYPLKAKVVTLGGFSAHGDKNELTRVLKESNLDVKRIALVHGEEDQSIAFKSHLEQQGFEVTVPYQGQTIYVP